MSYVKQAHQVDRNKELRARRDLGNPSIDHIPADLNDGRHIAHQLGVLANEFGDDARELMATVTAALQSFWTGEFQQSFNELAPTVAREMRNGLVPELLSAQGHMNAYVNALADLRQRAAREVQRGESADAQRYNLLNRREEVKTDIAEATAPAQQLQQQVVQLNNAAAEQQEVVTQAQLNLANIREERRQVDGRLASGFRASADVIQRGRAWIEQNGVSGGGGGAPTPGEGSTGPVGSAPAPTPPDIAEVGEGGSPPSVGGAGGTETGAMPTYGSAPGANGSGRFDPTGSDLPTPSGDDGGLGTGEKAAMAAGGAALLGGAAYAASRARPGASAIGTAPSTAGSTGAGGSSSRSSGGGTAGPSGPPASAGGAVGASAEEGRRTGEGANLEAMIPVAAVAASAAAGVALAGRFLDRPASGAKAAKPHDDEKAKRWYRLGRRKVTDEQVAELERAIDRAATDGELAPPRTTEVLPGGVIADLPAGWTVARTDDCAVLTATGPAGRFRPNIVVLAEQDAPREATVGVEELPASVVLEAEALAGGRNGNRARFGYAVGETALTVHRQQLVSQPGVTAVLTASVATERVSDDLPELDRVLASFRPAPALADA